MTKMSEITDNMATYVCDSLCRHTADETMKQEELEKVCESCGMADHIHAMLNEYSSLKKQNDNRLAVRNNHFYNKCDGCSYKNTEECLFCMRAYYDTYAPSNIERAEK